MTTTALPEADRQRALERFRLLQPHLEEGTTLTQVAREAGIPYRTAQRWVALYQRFGLVALARKPRADRGARRSLSPQMHKVIEGLALQKPPLPITALYRQVCRLTQQRGEKPPTYAVVYDVVRQLPADLVMLAHEGDKAYADAFEMVHRREADRPNAIWQADHTLLDILPVREDGTTAKPWLTVIVDDYSRVIAGYFLFFEAPSSLQTALALRQAIWRKDDARWQVCGIPEALYTDNGSDFTSHHLEQVAADIKMQMLFSTPGKPRGRGRIERFFGGLASMFLPGLPQPPPYAELTAEFSQREKAIRDPTSLILIDEAERLKVVSLEAMRDIFDRGGLGLILIGMPGIEKRLARYPQLYSRIGFVHEFRPLSVAEVRRLLDESWVPPGVSLPSLDSEAVAAIIWITGGNFRLLHRLLAQAERIAQINALSAVTRQVIEAARESLVIGHL